MKKVISIITAALLILGMKSVHAQILSFNWTKQAGGTTGDYGYGIATDGLDNAIVTGRFKDTATFGPGETNETVLNSSDGSHDIFIAKYDGSGSLVWANQAGGTMVDYGNGIATDEWGSAIVTGNFEGTATFGAGEANETVLNSYGEVDIFIAKYDASGNLRWARKAGGTGVDHGNGIVTDGSGQVFITGRIEDNATFAEGEANETVLTAYGGMDIFIAKYDGSGNLVWAKKAGGKQSDYGSDITMDGAGNLILTGRFADSVTFGEGEANETVLTSNGSADIFLAKYDGSGSLFWAKMAGGSNADEGESIVTDGSGNVMVTGSFIEPATFGAGEANEIVLTGYGFYDMFIAKYGRSGDLVWAKEAGGTGSDSGSGIVSVGSGNAVVTGSFEGTATFGTGDTNETVLTSYGSVDVFVAKYDASGSLEWVRSAGGEDIDSGRSIAKDGSGNCIVTGGFMDIATFGPATLNSAGDYDIFITRLGPPSITVSTPDGGETWPVGGTRDITWASVGISEVNLELSSNGGTSWQEIESHVPSTPSTYTWTIPDLQSTDCIIKVSDPAYPDIFDVSDNAFTITQKMITVTSPNGGETWLAGSTKDVTWTSVNVPYVDILYSLTNGANWEKCTSNMLSTGIYSWVVPGIPSNQSLIKIMSSDDNTISDVSDALFIISSTGVETGQIIIPETYSLFQNHPNPFNPETRIKYAVPEQVHVKIDIVNITGKKIATLQDDVMNVGFHVLTWDGRDGFGRAVSGGLYLCSIKAGSFKKVIRMVFMK